MVTEATVFSILMVCIIIAAILYVVFGQVTVRKLRKNPVTKNELGMEFVSGWDIINVAQALAIPESISKKFSTGKLAFLHANAELLWKHTNKFDRFLAFTFYWLFMSSGLFMAGWALLDVVGLLD